MDALLSMRLASCSMRTVVCYTTVTAELLCGLNSNSESVFGKSVRNHKIYILVLHFQKK